MTREETVIVLSRTINWMEMTPEQQTETVQAVNSSYQHYCYQT